MHGQKRNDYKLRARDPVVAEGRQSKAQQWFQLSGLLIQKRKDATATANDTTTNNDDDDANAATLALLSKLLLVNPDPMYLWNHRRDLLVQQNHSNNSNNNNKNKNTMEELELTQQCLGRNSKAYSVWFHRKWWMQRIIETSSFEAQITSKEDLLQQELELTTQFLLLDERNFHCWNYRRFVIGLLGDVICGTTNPTAAGEWTWLTRLTTSTPIPTMKKQMGRQLGQSSMIDPILERNHGTSSTKHQHQQHQQLQDLLDSEWDFTTTKINANFSNGSAFHYRSTLVTLRPSADVSQELELIHNAIFTEPDDQTAWWYLEFLLSQGLLSNVMLQREKELLLELVADEDESKWVWLGLYNVVSRMENEQVTVLESLDRLIELDMDRKGRYEYLKETMLEK